MIFRSTSRHPRKPAFYRLGCPVKKVGGDAGLQKQCLFRTSKIEKKEEVDHFSLACYDYYRAKKWQGSNPLPIISGIETRAIFLINQN